MGRKKQTLEAQIIAIMGLHDLSGITIGASKLESGRIFFSANAHAKKNHAHICTSGGHDHETISATLGEAVAKLRAERGDMNIDFGTLETMEEPADAQAD